MNDIREDIACAGNPVTLWQSRVPMADVKIGALGLQDELGAMLWRMKYRDDLQHGQRAVLLLAKRMAQHGRWQRAVTRPSRIYGRSASSSSAPPTDNLLHRLAFRVLWEWVNDRCTACHGRGTLGPFGKTVMCKMCGGSGRMPTQHDVRSRDLGVSMAQYKAVWLPVIDRLLGELSVLDSEVASGVLHQIKNNLPKPLHCSEFRSTVHVSTEA